MLCTACGTNAHDPAPADSGERGSIVVSVTKLRNDKGGVIARLYRGGDGFPSDAAKAYREVTVKIEKGAAAVIFENIPHGEYAIWICHDENGNGKLDTNFIGMPKEGVGVSGPPPSFIPKYDDARFRLEADRSEHEIELKYL
jgi:uncharacterized protein (DUF2141 family)